MEMECCVSPNEPSQAFAEAGAFVVFGFSNSVSTPHWAWSVGLRRAPSWLCLRRRTLKLSGEGSSRYPKFEPDPRYAKMFDAMYDHDGDRQKRATCDDVAACSRSESPNSTAVFWRPVALNTRLEYFLCVEGFEFETPFLVLVCYRLLQTRGCRYQVHWRSGLPVGGCIASREGHDVELESIRSPRGKEREYHCAMIELGLVELVRSRSRCLSELEMILLETA